MADLIILGSSNAISDEEHENTHMVLVGASRVALIDAVGNPVSRLAKAGIPFESLTDVVLTHFHPDHVSGVPLLLMDMWLRGRRKPLDIYGIHHTMARVENMMNLYGWQSWPNFFPVAFHYLPAEEKTPVLDCEDFAIYSSPVHHLIPTIGLRVDFKKSGKAMAYSCDTEPCEEVVRLAEGADVLIHEAAGALKGHSSAAQAAEIARKAEVGALYLIHYPTGKYRQENLVEDARTQFQGEIALAEDFMRLAF
jgi:ribonuclease Z